MLSHSTYQMSFSTVEQRPGVESGATVSNYYNRVPKNYYNRQAPPWPPFGNFFIIHLGEQT